MRRCQQLDDRGPIGLRFEKREDAVDRRGKRLTREWQRIERLVGHVAVGQDLAGKIEIRQWTLEHDSEAIELRRPYGFVRRPRAVFQPADEFGEFLFAV